MVYRLWSTIRVPRTAYREKTDRIAARGSRLAGRSWSGFTLIELVIAVVVLSIGISTLLVIMANVMKLTVIPQTMNIAAGLAEEQLELVTAGRYSAIVNQGLVSFGGNFSNYSYQVQVAPVPAALANDPAMAQYKQVQVTVQHATAGAVTLTTVATNR